MWRNQLKIAFRNLWKQKTFSTINVVGLALGMACCFMILQYVWHEMSYDDFHTNKDRIYRLDYHFNTSHMDRTPPTLGPEIAKVSPEVESMARLYRRDISIGVEGTNNFFESNHTFFADSSVTEVFDMDFTSGIAATALDRPFSVVLTESMATRLFGNTEVLNNNVKIGDDNNYKVTGVIKDWPENSHLEIEILVHYRNMIDVEPEHAREALLDILASNKAASHGHTYFLLKPNTDPKVVDTKIATLLKTFGAEHMRDKQIFNLSNIQGLHLFPPDGSRMNINMLYLFMAIGFIILLIACINFINLTTASSLNRAKEVGVRKVLGARRSSIIGQFLGESMMLSLIAFLLSLVIVQLTMPALNSITGLHLMFRPMENPTLLGSMIGIFLVAGFLAGVYPAFFVSKFQAITAMKGGPERMKKPGGITIRKILITLQFIVAIAFISGALTVFLQLDFLRNKPIGFKKELFISIPIDNRININALWRPGDATIRQRMNTLDDILVAHPNVLAVTQCSSQPGFGAIGKRVTSENLKNEDNFFPRVLAVDYDYVETLELEVLTGRDFDVSHGTDHLNAFMINESTMKEIGYKEPEEALGEKMTLSGRDGQVIGVVKDFNFGSLHNEIDPLVMEVLPGVFKYYGIRVGNADIPQTLAFIESKWKDFFPNKVFEYSFLDDDIKEAYEREEQLTTLISYFAFIAIFISCFGLFGLAVLITKNRFKEIGIRKILGASIPQILNILAKDFLLLIAIAMLLAIPLTWYFVNSWMDEFAYRIDFPWWVPLVAGLGAIVLAFITISSQTIKAATSNPVEALRYE